MKTDQAMFINEIDRKTTLVFDDNNSFFSLIANVNAFRDFGGVAPLLVQIILMLKFWFSICPEAPK